MNFRLITQTMGYILWVEAGFLLLPALTACVCGEVYWRQFLLTAALIWAIGLTRNERRKILKKII